MSNSITSAPVNVWFNFPSQAVSPVYFMDCVYLIEQVASLHYTVVCTHPESVYLGDLDAAVSAAASQEINGLIYSDHCCDRGHVVV